MENILKRLEEILLAYEADGLIDYDAGAGLYNELRDLLLSCQQLCIKASCKQ